MEPKFFSDEFSNLTKKTEPVREMKTEPVREMKTEPVREINNRFMRQLTTDYIIKQINPVIWRKLRKKLEDSNMLPR